MGYQMVKDLSAYYKSLMAKKQVLNESVEVKTPEVLEEATTTLEEEFVVNSHGYDIFKEDETFYFHDNGTKYVSRNFMKLEDKALELKDLNEPMPVESDTFESIDLIAQAPGKWRFESPWGAGTVSVSQLNGKDKIHITCGSNTFFGETKLNFYYGDEGRIKELIRVNLNTDKVGESHNFRAWSNASGKTAFEQLYGDEND